jgi:hypothetical protein
MSDSRVLAEHCRGSADETEWLTEMSPRLKLRVPDEKSRIALLKTVRYEASRGGLDPQLTMLSEFVAWGALVRRIRAFPWPGTRWLLLAGPI